MSFDLCTLSLSILFFVCDEYPNSPQTRSATSCIRKGMGHLVTAGMVGIPGLPVDFCWCGLVDASPQPLCGLAGEMAIA